MSPIDLTAQRQFEIDLRLENANALIEVNKKCHEESARQELNARLGNTLADFQTRPTWTAEKVDNSDSHIYTLSMKVVFKP